MACGDPLGTSQSLRARRPPKARTYHAGTTGIVIETRSQPQPLLEANRTGQTARRPKAPRPGPGRNVRALVEVTARRLQGLTRKCKRKRAVSAVGGTTGAAPRRRPLNGSLGATVPTGTHRTQVRMALHRCLYPKASDEQDTEAHARVHVRQRTSRSPHAGTVQGIRCHQHLSLQRRRLQRRRTTWWKGIRKLEITSPSM